MEVCFADMYASLDSQEYPEECIDLEYVDSQEESQRLNSEPRRADVQVELQGLRADIDHVCSAWLEARAAAEVTSQAVKHFHFLMTDSDVSEDSRAAAHQEFKASELCRQISGMRETIETLQQESKHKDEVIAVFRTRSASVPDIPPDGAHLQHDSINWRNLYEEEQQRFKELKEQNNQLRTEAERVYETDSERSYKECQAELIEAQGQNKLLTEQLRKTEETCLCWEHEAKQYKEEPDHCSACFREQFDVQNKEMLGVVKKYRGKVQDSEHWDKDGLITKNK